MSPFSHYPKKRLQKRTLSRRRFLTQFVVSGSFAAGSSLFLKGCAPDFAALEAKLTSESPDADEAQNSQPADAQIADAQAADDSAETALNNSSGVEPAEIKVGLLHSLSGSMALSEAAIVDAERMAIDEINAAGGVLGKQLVPVQEDGASDWPTFAEKAEKLIDQREVAVIFGGLTSASRKAILPVVKAKNRLLWYPGSYEGQECSRNVFYAGSTANQQIEPAVNWMLGNRGKSFFLVSANARNVHNIVRAQLKEKGGKVAGEAYVPMTAGTNVDMSPVMKDIKEAMPEGGIILNSLVGSANRAFFRALTGASLSANKYLVMSVRVTEEEAFQIGPELLNGHYAASSYFQSIEGPDNQEWVKRFHDQYGADRVIGDAMVSAYTMVHLWAQAVEAAQSIETEAVRAASYGLTFAAPQGRVTVQPNHHLSKPVSIGKLLDNAQVDILDTKSAIAPNPWSQYLPNSKGYSCDWSDPDKKGKYKPEASEPAPQKPE
ncbi:MAG: urea ABC transporter substrate-binding protein [Cyanobacteria bacterium J06634_5]